MNFYSTFASAAERFATAWRWDVGDDALSNALSGLSDRRRGGRWLVRSALPRRRVAILAGTARSGAARIWHMRLGRGVPLRLQLHRRQVATLLAAAARA